jgi:phospholipid transport system substrate-binding protein
MRNIYFAIFCLLLFALPSLADEAGEVQDLLKRKLDAIVVLLQDKTVDKVGRNEQVTDIITPIFDYRAMARLSLGKKHWSTLGKEQQTEFSDLFIARLQKSYLDKLDLFSDEKVLYGEPQVKGKKVHMPTTLVSKGRRIEMLYKFYNSRKGWQVYDVEIGGVSVIQTYRSQFGGVLSEGTIDDLLEKLKTDGAFVIAAPNKQSGSD